MTIKWKGWPHLEEMQQLECSTLEQIIDHGLAFEQALREDVQLPRRSRVKRRRADGSEKRRFLRTLFYQPSTRTEGTFINAAAELECDIHAVKDPKAFSEAIKGESFEMAYMAYTAAGGMGFLRGCDGVIIRHPEQGAVKKAIDLIETALGDVAKQKPIAVINAGDGKSGQHPTQTITDLAMIKKKRIHVKHFLDDLTVFFPGDIRRNRVVRSLLYAFGKYGGQRNINILFSSPIDLGPDEDILYYLARHRVPYEFIKPKDIGDVVPHIDLWYSTRNQREYNAKDEPQKGKKKKKKGKQEPKPDEQRHDFVFKKEYYSRLKPGAFVKHPLPINEDPTDPPAEIDRELLPLAIAGDEKLPFGQNSHLHIPMRAALLDIIFEGLDKLAESKE